MLTYLAAFRRPFFLLLLLPFLIPSPPTQAASTPMTSPMTLDVWPKTAPGEQTAEPGRITDDHSGGVSRMTDVTRPQLFLYPAAGKGLHPAVLVCPGGGYGILSVDLEGSEVALWLNGLGFTAAVLHYRVPNKRDGAFQDGQRSLSLLRANAKKYGIDPHRLGVLGFSAGGHLSARLASGYGARSYPPIDAADNASCRPDFAALIYPAYLIDAATGLPAPEVQPHPGMPPVFLTQTRDDPYLDVPAYAAALELAGVSTRWVIYDVGGHGYGLRLPATQPAHQWSEEAAAWLAHPRAADYRQKARDQIAYIQDHFYDPAEKKYHDTVPRDPKALPWAFMWANGVQWRALVDAARDAPAKYRPVLDAYGDGLQQYWDPRETPPGFNAYCSGPGGHDKYYDDNAWMVLGFIEAYQATREPRYLKWAQATQDFVLSGWDDKLGGGIYWSLEHKSKNTCDNAPAAVSALRLAALGHPEQRDWAHRLIQWTNANLQDKDGLYWDCVRLDGSVEKTKWTYNTALMIEADVLQSQTSGDTKALREAERLADAAISEWQSPVTGAFANDANFTHLLCESFIRLYEADHQGKYLNAVRRHATFASRYVHDPSSGYWSHWTTAPHQADERKSLLENASVARLFYLLAPYPDGDALYEQGIAAASQGKNAAAEDFFREAADSDTQAVEARYRLWKILVREKKTAAAGEQAQALTKLAADPALRARLLAVGWQEPSPKAP